MEKFKKIAVIAVFFLVIFGLALAHMIIPDKEISQAERRRLEKMPEITSQSVFNGKYFKDLEKYLLDHFPARDDFRSIKAVTNYKVFGIKDNNDVYIKDGNIMRLEYPLKENQVNMAIKRINAIIESHPQLANAYYSIIPDKNYFLAAENGYPAMDYEKLFEIISNGVKGAEYIDITDKLSLNDYYKTDSHWSQDKIFPVVKELCGKMGVEYLDESHYKKNEFSPFYGVYAGQAAMPVEPDTIVYLESPEMKDVTVKSVEKEEPIKVYTLEDLESMDPYEVFLSGAEAVVTIENPDALSDRELIIFRDSFGSSLTPLLIGSYSKITMLDLRYMTSSLVDDYADFENADVLFMYSTMLLNSGGILK